MPPAHPLLQAPSPLAALHRFLASPSPLPPPLATLLSLHAIAVTSGLSPRPDFAAKLVSAYSVGRPGLAVLAFACSPRPDTFLWNTLLRSHHRSSGFASVLSAHRRMRASGATPSRFTAPLVASAAAELGAFHVGASVHAYSVRFGLLYGDGSIAVASSLVYMYARCGIILDAVRLFDEMPERDVVAWTAVISGCVRNGECGEGLCYFVRMVRLAGLVEKAVELYLEMGESGLQPDEVVVSCLLAGLGNTANVRRGKEFHAAIVRINFGNSVLIGNALISMYAKCKKGTAKLDLMPNAWSCIEKCSSETRIIFHMLTEGVKPNPATLVIVISACANLAALERGELIHSYVRDMGWERDVSISTSLVDMYTKCGQLSIAREIFDSMLRRDAVTWNVMISGLVDEGRKLFIRMGEYSLEPNLKHYACMVDLLGKSGHLQEAEDMVSAMPIEPDGGIWGALLGACKMHGNIEMGLRVAKNAIASDPGGLEHDSCGSIIQFSADGTIMLAWAGCLVESALEHQNICITSSSAHVELFSTNRHDFS
ncbi:hypothetical protein GUJ93_ZPchr0004g40255 [Zizania palustris]|uniref:Pentatricopeptide repeat-containing protein n=1 Tax=Zizania palustris TaxID=103762 RepID=A0A8J5SES9_ZIZPA|nr:hypothetical protein GUJ93_ZPchr0004g40255 [Zizania palustris]